MSKPLSWDTSAHEYNSFEKEWHFYEKVARGLVNTLEPRPDCKILELACGTGACTALLASSCKQGEVVAIDQSQNMVEIARENLSNSGSTNVSFVTGEVGQLANLLREKSQFFDLAVCNSAFWHFPDQRQVLNNLHYLLKNYGRFGFSLSDWYTSEESSEAYRKIIQEVLSKHGIDPSKFAGGAMYGRERVDFVHLLETSGFKVIKDEHYEFEMPSIARAAWMGIPVFASRVGKRSDAIPDNVREEIRSEIRKVRGDDETNRETWKSKWRILVAEKLD
jgi:ubiquinone/menaquinone biosynthesis C-methylase UbiE